MARLFADENFPRLAALGLRRLGHNVVTAADAGLANNGVPDEIVLEYATRLGHAVVTYNWDEFVILHDRYPAHAGIIVCDADEDSTALARRIHQRILALGDLGGKLIEVPI